MVSRSLLGKYQQFPSSNDPCFAGLGGSAAVLRCLRPVVRSADATLAWLPCSPVKVQNSICAMHLTMLIAALPSVLVVPRAFQSLSFVFAAPLLWPAPRHGVVHAVTATCGISAGDPCSPHFLAFVLVPWTKLTPSFAGVKPFLYMDDRTAFPAFQTLSAPFAAEARDNSSPAHLRDVKQLQPVSSKHLDNRRTSRTVHHHNYTANDLLHSTLHRTCK